MEVLNPTEHVEMMLSDRDLGDETDDTREEQRPDESLEDVRERLNYQ